MSFASGDLFVISSSSNYAVANITLFKVASLADSSVQSASCLATGGGTSSSNATAIVHSLTGEASIPTNPITCKSGSNSYLWKFSKCGSYSPSVTVTRSGTGTGSAQGSAMMLASCASECASLPSPTTSVSDGITVLVIDFIQTAPAPSILRASVQSTRMEITARTILSTPGSVYCSVFPQYYVPPSVDVVLMGGNVASSSEENTTLVVTMSNLQAASSYSFYCATISAPGVKMSYEAMIKTKKIVSTLCCKYVKAELLVNSFMKGSSEQNAIRLSIDSPLSSDTTVYLNLNTFALVSDKAISAPSFFPEKVVFKAGAAISTVVAFLADTTGEYQLNFTLTGTNVASEVGLFHVGGQKTIRVLQANEKVPPPQFLYAEFSQTGASVTVKLTAPTDKAQLFSSFTCSRLLNFTGINI